MRNGVLVEIDGDVVGAWDFYRRDDKDAPMPFALRDEIAHPGHCAGPRPNP